VRHRYGRLYTADAGRLTQRPTQPRHSVMHLPQTWGHVTARKFFYVAVVSAILFLFLFLSGRLSSSVLIVFNFINSTSLQPAFITGEWRQLTLEEVFENFTDKTLGACDNDCNTGTFPCNAMTTSDWARAVQSQRLDYPEFMEDRTYIYAFEKDYLVEPAMTDKRRLPDLRMSRIDIHGNVNGTVVCNVNDVLTARVDMVDGYGRSRSRGGDEVRAWIVDSKTKNFRAASQVTDLKNGSYDISTRCLWPGQMEFNVAVQYPREYLRLVILQTHLGVAYMIVGKFWKNGVEEWTLCWSAPNIPGRPCVCNLTDVNGQSLYCGRPVKKSLTCKDWTGTAPVGIPPARDVTNVERELIKNTATKDIQKFLIVHSTTVVVNASGQLPRLKPCWQEGPGISWNTSLRPNGYWSTGLVWKSLQCQRPQLTPQWTHRCLRDTRIYTIGDSNAVRLYASLKAVIPCNVTEPGAWPHREVCRNDQLNVTMSFTPHEYPIICFPFNRTSYGSVPQQIDAIPAAGKVLVVFHYFVHMMQSHLAVVHARLKSARRAIESLLKRNPDAFVAIRGPHVSSYDWVANHATGADNLGTFYLGIIQEEFRDLSDRVLFLDGWGMTLALENAFLHPVDQVPKEMIRTLLAFHCNDAGDAVKRSFENIKKLPKN
ncbi:unnamed protein product, partial [Lymnaea stagnalis]